MAEEEEKDMKILEELAQLVKQGFYEHLSQQSNINTEEKRKDQTSSTATTPHHSHFSHYSLTIDHPNYVFESRTDPNQGLQECYQVWQQTAHWKGCHLADKVIEEELSPFSLWNIAIPNIAVTHPEQHYLQCHLSLCIVEMGRHSLEQKMAVEAANQEETL